MVSITKTGSRNRRNYKLFKIIFIMEIKKGDILLVHSHNIMGRIIQFGMNLEKWRQLSFKPFWKEIYNHAAICVEDGYIAEALAEGIVIHSFDSAYGKKKNRKLLIYRPNWTKEELDILYPTAIQYTGVKYQFINFIQYIPKILFGVWLGKTHVSAEDRLYCTEYVALVMNKITHGKLFKKYWRTSPSGVQNWCSKNCKLVYEIQL